MALLQIDNLHVHYGGIHALQGVSFSVEQGQIVALIGANGAGKTTTLRAISGLLKPSSGRIAFDGHDITGHATHEIVARGLVQAPEGRGIFANMSVDENLEIGAYLRRDRAAVANDKEQALALFPRLRERLTQSAGTLSGGEQQMLAIARALAGDPKVLLLDELSMGLAPLVVAELYDLVGQIAARGVTVVLVEQFVTTALMVATDAAIMLHGAIHATGSPTEMGQLAAAAYLSEG